MPSKKSKHRGAKAAHIKHSAFADRNITPLAQQQRDGNTIKGPLAKLAKVQFTSWVDDVLPDTLWAVLLTGALERDRCLAIFREVIEAFRVNEAQVGRKLLVHSSFAKLDDSVFDAIFKKVLKEEDVSKALAPLRIFESLPDRHHWARFLPDPNLEDHSTPVFKAVVGCYDHQSQSATDCRWVRLMSLFVLGRIQMPRQPAEELADYPSRGDQRVVRPSIRALEITTRDPNESDFDPAWCADFWKECYARTDCIPAHMQARDHAIDRRATMDRGIELYDAVIDHFFATAAAARIDAKHEASFGLVLYMIQTMLFCINVDVGKTAQGRIALRTALEAFINLRFLTSKDNDTIWAQYRNYGSGQAKLAFLKNLREDDIPDFVNLAELERYANEDMWLEFQDIELGVWSNKNLRKMAEECGVRDVYDKHYDILSAYAHGNWIAVRDSVFSTCMNPLHRLHRIPMPPRLNMNDVVEDIAKLINRAMDDLNHLYPGIKKRMACVWKTTEATQAVTPVEAEITKNSAGAD